MRKQEFTYISLRNTTFNLRSARPFMGKFGGDDVAISSGKLSITFHPPAGKSCCFESKTPNMLIHDMFVYHIPINNHLSCNPET